jgi:hypothetical protein
MISDLNPLAIAAAALATFLVGGPWYSPLLFGKAWQREMGMEKAQPGHPARVFGLAYLFSLVSCVLLSAFIAPGADAMAGLKLGAIVGLGFVAASFGVNYQFANRSFNVLLIDGGYHVVQFAAFGTILGAWPG